ncbi:MAG: tetratricopeptide repeat protein [Acidobacteriaceae bacterium]
MTCVFFITATPSATSQVATSSKAEVQLHLQRAQAALKAKTPAVAAREFRAVLALDPQNVEAHANLGILALFQGNCSSAEPELRSALKVAPSLIKARALLAICEKRLGQPSAQSMLEDVFAKLQEVKLRTQVGMELADLYYQQGNLEKTASVMHTLVDLAPDNVDILFFTQRVYSELADNTLNKLAVLAPGSARMEQLIAERLINAGDSRDAIPHYRKAIQLNPILPGMHFELAEAILQSSPHDAQAMAEAQKQLAAAVKVDGDSPRIESELGQLALQQFNNAEALAHFKQAYTMDPADVDAEMGMAQVLKIEDKPQEAVRYLRMAVHADPMNADAHYQLAQVCRRLHLTEEEQKELRLFQEVKAAKDEVKDIYREMNPQTAAQGEALSAAKP